MPEGDTVYRQCRILDQALAGAVLTRVELRVPQASGADLVGATVREVRPRGKHILIRLEAGRGLTLHSHLQMDGAWQTDGRMFTGGDVTGGRRPAHTIRIVLEATRPDGCPVTALAYDVKQVRLLPTSQEDELLGHLGPDLLDPGWDESLREQAIRNIVAQDRRPVGLTLLDQRVMAGPGNIYRSELCFLSRLHPTAPTSDLADPGGLVDLAHRLLDLNKGRAMRVTTGGMMGRHGDLWVYGRTGKPCFRCGTRIERGMLGDPELEGTTDRAYFFCPRCQSAPESR